ncbi:MAG: endolytic transglycosylase MltG [Patescibacteria group bacterium]
MYGSFLETMKRRRPSRRLLIIIGAALVALLFAFVLLYARYFGPATDDTIVATEFIVAPDSAFETVAQELKAGGYIKSMTAFRIASALRGSGSDIQEGGYMITPSMDAWTVAELLSEPPYLAWITFPPGWRKEQIAEYLTRKLGWSDEQKAQFIDVDTASSLEETEGVYYGDTYLIPSDQPPAQVAARLRARFQEVFAPYAAQAAEKNVTWTEALTMASLIEREAAKNDKHLISGILWNRINDGMRLQVDASLQYIRGEEGNWWPVPRSEDKDLESPFNSYKYAGLPPHPIANPSLESIEAALNPEDTNCVFYLHDNDGVIHCSPNYAGHLANINRYLR